MVSSRTLDIGYQDMSQIVWFLGHRLTRAALRRYQLFRQFLDAEDASIEAST